MSHNMQKYEAANKRYAEALAKSKTGDAVAFADKAKIVGEIRQMERDAAKQGTIIENGKHLGETETKRSLQEQYVRKFDNERPVNINGKETTMQAYHRDRLLKKAV